MIDPCPGCGYTAIRPKNQWSFELHGVRAAPSLNQIGVNSKGISGIKYRRQRSWCEEQLRRVAKQPTQATGKRRVWFTRYYARKKYRYDRANFASGCKPLLDVIVANGWVKNDSPKWLDDYYHQTPAPDGRDRLLVLIEEP